MNYILMHKHIPVVSLDINEETGHIEKIGEVYNEEHIPVGTRFRKGIIERADLNEWWLNRSIPASRSGLRTALEALGIRTPGTLIAKCYGLSLSDQYWIKPENSNISWNKVNFFDNPFSEDIGDILFGRTCNSEKPNLFSPDNTSNGNLLKRWKIINEKRYLVKGGSRPFQQQPFNEVIASKIMQVLGISHIDYEIIWDGNRPYCICENFVTRDAELIPAWQVIKTQKKSNSTSWYQHYINCCKDLGIKGIIHSMDEMLTLDYIIANEDRHLNNFGLIRNAETLEFIGVAPIFDSGSSLGYELLTPMIRNNSEVECKPFKMHHNEQIKLVSSFEWLDFSALGNVSDIIADVFSDPKTSVYVDKERISAIVQSVGNRIRLIQNKTQNCGGKANISNDILYNTAKSYE